MEYQIEDKALEIDFSRAFLFAKSYNKDKKF